MKSSSERLHHYTISIRIDGEYRKAQDFIARGLAVAGPQPGDAHGHPTLLWHPTPEGANRYCETGLAPEPHEYHAMP